MFSLITAPSASSVFSAYTTFAASSMLVRTVISDVHNIGSQILPGGLQEKILFTLGGLLGTLSPQMTLVIDEYNKLALNQIYISSEAYLRTKITPSVGQLKAFQGPQDTDISLSINKGEKIVDVFDGVQVTWELISIETQKTSFDYDNLFSSENVERKSFELRFNRKDKEIVLRSYLPHVMEIAKSIKQQNQVVRLYALGNFYGDTELNHPSTFDTLAIEPTLKKEVLDDLDRFIKRRNYYCRVGKAWKRGYLLYGPPGTGKSSMIAAMANYLKFDIYDLELASLQNNADLKRTLVSIANRSILAIEDIDCSIELNNRQDENYNQNNQKVSKHLT